MTRTMKAFALGTALLLLPCAPLRALAHVPLAQEQDRHDQNQNDARNHTDYSHSSYYQLGNREGYEDYQKKSQRKGHKHQYHTDDDRRAHDAGYQNGWQGHQYTEDNRPH